MVLVKHTELKREACSWVADEFSSRKHLLSK